MADEPSDLTLLDRVRLDAYRKAVALSNRTGTPLPTSPVLGSLPADPSSNGPMANAPGVGSTLRGLGSSVGDGLGRLAGAMYPPEGPNPASQYNGNFPYRGGYSLPQWSPTTGMRQGLPDKAPLYSSPNEAGGGNLLAAIQGVTGWDARQGMRGASDRRAAYAAAHASPPAIDSQAPWPDAPVAQLGSEVAASGALGNDPRTQPAPEAPVPTAQPPIPAGSPLSALANPRPMAPPPASPARMPVAQPPAAMPAAAPSAAAQPQTAPDGTVMIGGVPVSTTLKQENLPAAYDPEAAGKMDMSSGEPWKALLRFGLATMAAGGKPGVTTLGALGEGGLAATDAMDKETARKQMVAFQKYQTEVARTQAQNQIEAAKNGYTLNVAKDGHTASNQDQQLDIAKGTFGIAQAKEARDAQYDPQERVAKLNYMNSLAANAGKGSYGTQWQPIQTDKGLVFYDPDTGKVANPGAAGFNAVGLGARNTGALTENQMMANYNKAVTARDNALKGAFRPEDKAKAMADFNSNPAVQAWTSRSQGATGAPAAAPALNNDPLGLGLGR